MVGGVREVIGPDMATKDEGTIMKTQTRVIIAVVLTSFFTSAYIGVTQVLLAYIMVSYPGVSATTATQLLALPALIGLFAAFGIGPLAVKISKKILLAIALSCSAAAILIFVFVGSNGPFTLLLVGAALTGLHQGSATTLIASFVSEFFDAERRATYMALSSSFIAAGMAFMSFFSGIIASMSAGVDWQYGYIPALLIIPVIIVFLIVMPKSPVQENSAGQETVEGTTKKAKSRFAGWKPFGVIMAALFMVLISIGSCAFSYNISSYIITEYELGTSAQVGIASSILTITGMVVGLSYALWAKFLKRWVATFGFLVFAAGILCLIMINTSIVGVYLGSVLMGIGVTLVTPFLMTRATMSTPPQLIPIALSLVVGMGYLTMYASPYIFAGMGLLFGEGIAGVLIGTIVVLAVGAGLSVFMYGRKDKEAADHQGELTPEAEPGTE
jgi:MFS family permease